jgi:hypothetical protein
VLLLLLSTDDVEDDDDADDTDALLGYAFKWRLLLKLIVCTFILWHIKMKDMKIFSYA